MNPIEIFGDINAATDAERKQLEYNFVNINSFFESANVYKYLLIGFKGSGKTALVRKMMMCGDTTKCDKECTLHPKFCENVDFEGIYINADKDLHLNELLTEYAKESYQQVTQRDYGRDMMEVWGILCKIKVFEKMPELQDDKKFQELKSIYLGSKNGKKIIMLEKLIGFGEKAFTRIDNTPVADEVSKHLYDHNKKENLFYTVEKKAREILKSYNKNYYIIFDGFDHFLDKPIFRDKPELKMKFIRDLSDSLRTLGYNFQDDSPGIGEELIGLPNVYLKILLPRDFIIEKLRDDIKYLDKARSVQLRWFKKDLKEFITSRLSYFINKKPTDFSKLEPDNIWKQVFAERIKNPHYGVSESSFDYILRHTSHRPRDLQIICREIIMSFEDENRMDNDEFLKWLKKSKDNRISEEHIKNGVNSGSRELVTGLCSEFEVMPNLEELMAPFNKKSQILKYDEVYNLVQKRKGKSFKSETPDLIKILFRIGFLGKFISGGTEIMYKYRHKYPLMQVQYFAKKSQL